MPKPFVHPRFYPTLIEIGLNVAYYRKKKNLTQEELSELTNLSRKTISCIEASDRNYSMALASLLLIAEALEIPIKKLFDFRTEES